MDDTDFASDSEQKERDSALAHQRRRAVLVDVAPQVCADCDAFPQQRACADYKDCLVDFGRRQSAAERNGRGG